MTDWREVMVLAVWGAMLIGAPVGIGIGTGIIVGAILGGW